MKRSKDKRNEARMRVLKHETAPAITKHNEERDSQKRTEKLLPSMSISGFQYMSKVKTH